MLHPLTPAFYIPIVHGQDKVPHSAEHGSSLHDMVAAIDDFDGNYMYFRDQLVAVFCVEGQQATDVSETVAKAWIDAHRDDLHAVPQFVKHNADDYLDACIAADEEAGAEYAAMVETEGRIYRASVL